MKVHHVPDEVPAPEPDYSNYDPVAEQKREAEYQEGRGMPKLHKPRAVVVYDLSSTREQTFVGVSPREAVIAAYAQSRGDYSTWEYEGRYGGLVILGNLTVACGDFCASRVDPSVPVKERPVPRTKEG